MITGDRTVVLLVEDTSDIAHYIRSCFSTDHYQFIWARDGAEGRDKAIQWVPDIIISDVRMPGMSGFELCETLKKHPATNHIPIIMLTALADKKSRLEGLQAQADVYLEKPFQEETLVLTVTNLLNTRNKLAAYYASRSGNITGPSQEPQLTVAQDGFVQRFQQVLATNATDPLFGVEEMSNQLFLSRAQLHRKMKAILGQTPSDLLREYRLEKAKLMLRTEPLPIAQIALSCGFNDASYFSKVFTAAYNISPSNYCKQRG
jgi:DNA-binding response OmpR family regulator